MGYCPSYNSGYVELNETDWVTAAMAGKPAIAANDDFVDKLYETIRNDPNKEARPTLKFVHFTDIHMDMLYRAGASKKCPDVICCREEDGYPTDPKL